MTATMLLSGATVVNAEEKNAAVLVDDSKMNVIVNSEFFNEEELLGYNVLKTNDNSVLIKPVPCENDSSARLVSHGQAETAKVLLRKDITPQTGVVVINTRISKESLNGIVNIPSVYDSEGKQITNLKIDDKDLYAGEVKLDHVGIAKNFWYSIKIAIDTEKDVYDVYIDDALIGAGIAFDNPAENVSAVEYSINGTDTGAIYVDYLRIYCDNTDGIIEYEKHVNYSDEFATESDGWEYSGGTIYGENFAGVKEGSLIVGSSNKAEAKAKKTFEKNITGNAKFEFDLTMDDYDSKSVMTSEIIFYNSNGNQVTKMRMWNWYFLLSNASSSNGDVDFTQSYYGKVTEYRVSFEFDLKNKVYSVGVINKATGEAVLPVTSKPMRGSATDNIKSMCFYVTGSVAAELKVDNLDVYVTRERTENGDYFQNVASEYEDFSDEDSTGWSYTDNTLNENCFAGAKDGVLELTKPNAGAIQKATKELVTPVSDKAIIEYDFMIHGGNGNADVGLFYDSNGVRIADIGTFNWYIRLNQKNGTGYDLIPNVYYSVDKFYHAVFEFDFAKQSYYITITETETGKEFLRRQQRDMRPGSEAKDLSKIEFNNSTSATTGLYIDNFTVKIPEPRLVSAELSDGTPIRNASNISYNEESIILEFSTEMDIDSLVDNDNGLVLKNMTTNEAVAHTVTLDETKKFATFLLCEEVLEKDTKYMLTVPGMVKATSGLTIGNEESFVFLTERDYIKVERINFYDSMNRALKNYGDLTSFKGFIQVANYNTDYSVANLIIAIYDEEGALASCDITPVTLSEYGSAIELEPEITIPGDGKDYKVSMMVWYGIDNMKPVIKSYSINK